MEIKKNKELLELKPKSKKSLDLRGMKVLIVDDNPINIMVATQFFKKWNMSYDSSESGDEAIKLCKTKSYDIILMDLQMPEKDGYETTKEIRSEINHNQNKPIIALSASTSIDVLEKVLASGMNQYLSKPFNPKDLYDILSQFYQKDKIQMYGRASEAI